MNENESINDCVERLNRRFRIVSVVLVGSAAGDPEKALDVDLCVVVRDDVLDRGRMRVDGLQVDFVVCGEQRIRAELQRGPQHHLKIMFAGGRHVYGDHALSRELIALAGAAIARPAPLPLPPAQFAYRSKPYTLLKKFHDVHREDRATAGLIVSVLVQAAVEAFFALNGLWMGGIRQTMSTMAGRDPAAAAALERVTAAGLETLCDHPELLDSMVDRLVGPEPLEEERWIVRTSASSAA